MRGTAGSEDLVLDDLLALHGDVKPGLSVLREDKKEGNNDRYCCNILGSLISYRIDPSFTDDAVCPHFLLCT